MRHLESRLSEVFGEGSVYELALDLWTEAAVTGSLSANAAQVIADDLMDDVGRARQDLREVLQVL